MGSVVVVVVSTILRSGGELATLCVTVVSDSADGVVGSERGIDGAVAAELRIGVGVIGAFLDLDRLVQSKTPFLVSLYRSGRSHLQAE